MELAHTGRRADLGRTFWALAVSTGTVVAIFLWQGRVGFNLWDEGYLWYGVQRVMAGEVPLRDFSAYDPGRYYWSAAVMRAWGDGGLVSLRVAAALFQILGLSAAIAALALPSAALALPSAALAKSSVATQRLFWLLAAVTIAVWMAPPHRLFDGAVALTLIATLAYLVAKPTGRRFFLTGVIVGLAAVFGRNHGVYGLLGSLTVIAYLAFRHELGSRLVRVFGSWCAGITLGYLPTLLLLVLAPGAARAFAENLAFLWEIRATDINLPVPWPWRAPPTALIAHWQHVLIGTFFIALLAYTIFAVAWLLLRGRRSASPPVFVASAALALPYSHYAFPRADLEHLALGIFPLLLAALATLSTLRSKPKWLLGALLCAASTLTMLPLHAAWVCRPSQECVTAAVAGDPLFVDKGTAGHLWLLERLAEDFAPGERAFVAAPYWPGAYAALERRSPMWDIYAIFPTSTDAEQAEIARIRAADPGFVVIYDGALDDRADLNFGATHPLVDRYIRDHFEPVSGYTTNPIYRIYRARPSSP